MKVIALVVLFLALEVGFLLQITVGSSRATAAGAAAGRASQELPELPGVQGAAQHQEQLGRGDRVGERVVHAVVR
jgi:hypothetical protein